MICTGFIGFLRSSWNVLEFECSIFWNFGVLKFQENILVKFGISPLLGYSSLAYLTKLPTVYYISVTPTVCEQSHASQPVASIVVTVPSAECSTKPSVWNVITLPKEFIFHSKFWYSASMLCLFIDTFGTFGSIAAPTVWNSLPSSIRSSTSADTFCRLFKTHCFQQAYCSP